MKAVLGQADPMRLDREDGGKGWVLIDDSGWLLIWSVVVLLLSCTTRHVGGSEGWNKASKPASLSSRCGCCSAAAVASPPARRLASALCRCLN